MAEQSQGPTVSTMPHTWQKALEMWDAGDPVPAFQVESEGATQEQLWGEAFHCLKAETTAMFREGFTKREIDVVNSIVHVAKIVSWPQMISSHVDAKSPGLMIRKPKSDA